MHPNPAFRMKGDPLAFVAAQGFAHLFGQAGDGLAVAHVPLIVADGGTLLFHLANSNALTAHLDGRRALASIASSGSYVSANWYPDAAGNVPTWNYAAVEVEGPVRRLSLAELEDLLNRASATFEPRVGENWTMAKMDRARAEAMMRGITGFELVPDIVRHTDKASQNRSEADARALIAGMERAGDHAGAAAIRRTRGW